MDRERVDTVAASSNKRDDVEVVPPQANPRFATSLDQIPMSRKQREHYKKIGAVLLVADKEGRITLKDRTYLRTYQGDLRLW